MRGHRQQVRQVQETPDTRMAVLRVKAPHGTDPHVLEAALARALCERSDPSLTAEVTWLPAWRTSTRTARRRFGFVAVLRAAAPAGGRDLMHAAERAAARGLRSRFGANVSVRVREASDPREVSAFWCTVRGTPRRPSD